MGLGKGVTYPLIILKFCFNLHAEKLSLLYVLSVLTNASSRGPPSTAKMLNRSEEWGVGGEKGV